MNSRLLVAATPATGVVAGCLVALGTVPTTAGAQQSGGGPPPSGGSSPARAAVLRTARAPRHVTVGRSVRITGALGASSTRRTVVLELRSGRRWRVVDRASTIRGGRFRARWRPPGAGSYRLRVRPIDARATRSGERRINVYRASPASWFGPGLYGNGTACGRTLTPRLLGVAHRSLPCGTRVRFRYGRRTVTVPVVDRGPYAGGREWDLTAATKQALGFPSTGSVWSTH